MAHHALAFFLRVLDNQYQHAQREEFYARAHVYRFSVREYDAKNDAERQLQQIKDCLAGAPASRPKILFVNPVNESLLENAARETGRLGMGWVSLNRSCDYVTDLRRQYPKLTFICVDPDQRAVGRLQGRQLGILLPRGGDVLSIHGPLSTSSARLRLAGLETELAGSPIRVTKIGGDWTEASGFEAGLKWQEKSESQHDLQPNRLAIAAQNDNMAMGAYRALIEAAARSPRARRFLPPIIGCDGSPNFGQRFVTEHKLAATVVIRPTTARAIDEVVRTLNGGAPPVADVSAGVESFPEPEILRQDVLRRRAAGDGSAGPP